MEQLEVPNGQAIRSDQMPESYYQRMGRTFRKYNVSSVAFRYVDWQTFKALWRWCRRRHKNKPAAWIRDKYFHRIGNRSWTFSEKLTEDNYLALVYATDTNITRFTRIKAEANPYDEIWMEYFAERKNKSYSNFKFVYE